MSETLTNGVIVPDKGSRDWYADLRSNWLKLDSLMAGGNITINPAQTKGILVATITVGGKEYKLYQQDGDVSVKIDPSTENAEYPLVASTSAEANTGSVVMAPAVTVNPSTGAVTAPSFKGKLEGNASTATTATKAVQDGAGAVIADTYAAKSELTTKANDANVVHKSGTETIVGIKTFSGEVQTNTIRAVGGGANISLTPPDNGGFAIKAYNGTVNKELVGYPNGMLAWDNNEILTKVNGVTLDTAQTITGAKTFVLWQTFSSGLNVKWITGNKERKALFLYATMNDKYQGYGATLQLLSEELNGGFKLIAKDKTDTNVKALVGQSNGVLMWGSNNVLTDANQIMMLKNLTGAKITSGAVIDCGTGNGVLVGRFMNTAGAWTLANDKPTGKWKNANNYSLLAEESGMFVKVG